MLTACNPAPYWFPCPKNSGDTDDYQFDWSAFLGSDLIVSSSVVVTGVTLVTSQVSTSGTSVSMRLSGGISGTTASLTNTVTTQSGQTFVKTANLYIK